MFSVTRKILLLVGALTFISVIKMLPAFDDMFISCPPKSTFQWKVFGTSMVSCTLAVQFSVKVLYGGVTKAVTVCGCTLTSTTGPVGEKYDGSNYYSTHLKQKVVKENKQQTASDTGDTNTRAKD